MDAVRVIHDREGQTLTLWFGDPQREARSEQTDDGLVLMRDDAGTLLGVEILNYGGTPAEVSLQLLGQQPAAATR